MMVVVGSTVDRRLCGRRLVWGSISRRINPLGDGGGSQWSQTTRVLCTLARNVHVWCIYGCTCMAVNGTQCRRPLGYSSLLRGTTMDCVSMDALAWSSYKL